MTSFDQLVCTLTSWAVPGDPDRQAELRHVVSLSTDGGTRHRLREIAGIFGLGLQHRSSARLGGRRASLREGMAIAAIVAFLMGIATASAGLFSPWVGALLLAGALSAAAGSRSSVVVLAVVATVLVAATGGPRFGVTVAIGLAVACALWGRGTRQATVSSAGPLIVGLTIVAAGFTIWVSPDAVHRISSILAVVGLLVAARFDPKFGVVATVIMLCRFAAVDVGDLLASVAELGQRFTVEDLVLRAAAMSVGLVVSVIVTHRSFQRATLL